MIETKEIGAGSYPEPNDEKCFQFDFKASCGGYGIVFAKDKEEARTKITERNYDDIIEYFDYEIEEIIKIEEE